MTADPPAPDGEARPDGDVPPESEAAAPPESEAAAPSESEAAAPSESEAAAPSEPEAAAPSESGGNGEGAVNAVGEMPVETAVVVAQAKAPVSSNGGPRPSGGMRGMIDGLESPHPLGHTLPGVLQDDEFAQRFVSGLDNVLAPVFSTLDNFDAYLDPQLTPGDFLPWLAGWHGAEIDAGWPEARSRDLMSRLPAVQAGRGTIAALREILQLHTGAEPEIIDSGGAAWSGVPGGELPGSDASELTVRVKGQGVDRARIEALVREATPAHIVVHVEVVD
jgi:phage tail-like protein